MLHESPNDEELDREMAQESMLLRPQAEIVRKDMPLSMTMEATIRHALRMRTQGLNVHELRLCCGVHLTTQGQEDFNAALNELTKHGQVFVDSGVYKLQRI